MSTEVRLSKSLRSRGPRLCALLRQPHLRWNPAINRKAKELVIDTVGFGASSKETINDRISSCVTDEDHDYPVNNLDSVTESTGNHPVDSIDATYRHSSKLRSSYGLTLTISQRN
jgi:hypothetical protein